MSPFQPDYRHLVAAVTNRNPLRMPMYEHIVNIPIMEQVLNTDIRLQGEAPQDYDEYYRRQGAFWREMTYDTISMECCVTEVLPGGGALMGGKPYLLHSCGNIFAIMDDLIAAGFSAKHSNEDVIAPFETWIERYNDRTGLLGGIDIAHLASKSPQELKAYVVEMGRSYLGLTRGYAMGSGNSIPDYIPVENYLAFVEGMREVRAESGRA